MTAMQAEAILELSPDLQMELYDALNDCKEESLYGEIFALPVDYIGPPALDKYTKIVKRPMDYTTMEDNLERREYRHLYQFLMDLALVFENCKEYNTGVHYFKRAADAAERFCIDRFQKIQALSFLTFEKYQKIVVSDICECQSNRAFGANSARIQQLHATLAQLTEKQLQTLFNDEEVVVDYTNCELIEEKLLKMLD